MAFEIVSTLISTTGNFERKGIVSCVKKRGRDKKKPWQVLKPVMAINAKWWSIGDSNS